MMKRKLAAATEKKGSKRRAVGAKLGCGGSNDESSPDPKVIWFYDENRPWGEFSNFYGKKQDKRFRLTIDGTEWQTTEHYFQAQKFLGPDATDESRTYARLVASQNTPNKAAVLARQKTGGGYKWRTDLNAVITEYLEKGVELRRDWDEVCDSVMEKAVYAKFSQNAFLKELLLSTAGTAATPQEHEKEKKQEKETEEENEKGKEKEKDDEEKGSRAIKLMEHTSRDTYWADGGDGSGENMLGIILMRVRTRLLQEHSDSGK